MVLLQDSTCCVPAETLLLSTTQPPSVLDHCLRSSSFLCFSWSQLEWLVWCLWWAECLTTLLMMMTWFLTHVLTPPDWWTGSRRAETSLSLMPGETEDLIECWLIMIDPRFWSDLYHSLIILVSVVAPLLLLPPTIMVASVRACLHGHCCQVSNTWFLLVDAMKYSALIGHRSNINSLLESCSSSSWSRSPISAPLLAQSCLAWTSPSLSTIWTWSWDLSQCCGRLGTLWPDQSYISSPTPQSGMDSRHHAAQPGEVMEAYLPRRMRWHCLLLLKESHHYKRISACQQHQFYSILLLLCFTKHFHFPLTNVSTYSKISYLIPK